MKKYIIAVIVFLAAGLLLSACGQDSASSESNQKTTETQHSETDEDKNSETAEDTTSENKGSAEQDQEEEQTSKTTSQASSDSIKLDMAAIKKVNLKTSWHALKQQNAGKLTKDITYKRETDPVVWALPDMKQQQRQIVKRKLKAVTTQTESPKVLFKSIVYLLGSPYYKKVLNKIQDFEPDFVQPYLPTPKEQAMKAGKKASQSEKAIILLDASSSMLLKSHGQLKMEVAKHAVKRFANTIGRNKQNKVSLVVYGHKGSEAKADKQLSCHSIEQIYPMREYDKQAFNKAVSQVEAKGWTPLAGAIKKADKISQSLQGNITVYIVSDGKDTCGGDPVQAARQFVKNQGGDRTINIIGFDVDQASQKQLKRVAEAGHGEYYSADNPEELNNTFKKRLLPSAVELAYAFKKGPNGYDIVEQYQAVDHILKQLQAIMEHEDHRYQQAIMLLSYKDLVGKATIKQLKQLKEERYKTFKDMLDQLENKKHRQIENEAERIDQKVEEWVEKMKKLKRR